ncbi:hypothetical protein LWF15_17215 [Kineosporia rhizophila]|uniref:hypothetical protein n=1 Tax=Kineosporia TaxID=49184 RepID=UPI001E4AB717|nr:MULTISPECIES: hypothetical protein [Kineosporia]MCE0537244.1 hypothetical protein [Kineosporia rhizophila]GLY15908.1 hypothetical protein Kisp01_29230 [Kineosporia sp. NBRC 101677]
MPDFPPLAALTAQTRILELDDADAVRMLRVVLERQRRLPDPETARDLAAHLSEAAAHPLALEYPAPSAHSATGTDRLNLPLVSQPVSGGDLARETLLYLLTEQPALEPLLLAAADAADGPVGSLTRPGHLDLGVQVLLALHEEVTLERAPAGGWRFRVHRKAMNDASLTGVLAKLVRTVSSARS